MQNSNTFLNRVKELILPFLLCTVMNGAMFYIITLSFINVYWLISIAGTAAMFGLCSFVKKHKIIGTVLFLVVFAMVAYFVLSNINEVRKGIQAKNTILMILLIGFTFFNSCVVFYFTDVLYRAPFLMLASFIPCAFYVTLEVDMSMALSVPIIGLNIAIFLYYRKKEEAETAAFVNKKTSLVVLVDFLVAALFLGVLIPKSDVTVYDGLIKQLSLKRSFFMQSETKSVSGDFKEFSGNASFFRDSAELDKILLYTVNSDENLYLKRQVYDVYLPGENCWTYHDDYGRGYAGWEEDRKKLNYTDLLSAMKKADEYDDTIFENYNIDSLIESGIQEDKATAKITSNDFPARFLLNTDRTYKITIDGGYASKIYRGATAQTFTDKDYLDSDVSYYISYYPSDYSNDCPWIEAGGGNISLENYGELITKVKGELTADNDKKDYATVSQFLSEYNDAAGYYEDTYSEPSAKIKSLAQSITKDCTYDWEKAYALESYMSYTGGYTYDLEYEPPYGSEDIDYFIFESKKGTCSDFATAFALMARSLEIPVRYVEGYTTTPAEAEHTYYIYGSNSHAYCEAFIAGYGWMTFDPTAPSDEQSSQNYTFGNIEVNYNIVFYFSLILMIIIFLGLMFAMLHRQIFERIFRIRFHFTDSSNAVLMLYRRTVLRTKQQFREEAESFTPDIMSEFAQNSTCTDITPLVNPFVKVCYGKQSADSADKSSAYISYKTYYKNTKRKGRQFKR